MNLSIFLPLVFSWTSEVPSAFMFCSTNKGKRDTTLSYHIMNIAILHLLMFHIAYYCDWHLFIACMTIEYPYLHTSYYELSKYLILKWEYMHLMKQMSSWKFFYRSQLSLNCLRTSNKLSLGGVDTSKTYLLSRTFLLLFVL